MPLSKNWYWKYQLHSQITFIQNEFIIVSSTLQHTSQIKPTSSASINYQARLGLLLLCQVVWIVL